TERVDARIPRSRALPPCPRGAHPGPAAGAASDRIPITAAQRRASTLGAGGSAADRPGAHRQAHRSRVRERAVRRDSPDDRGTTAVATARCTDPATARARCVRLRERHPRSEEHTSELQSRENLVCRLLLEKKKNNNTHIFVQ